MSAFTAPPIIAKTRLLQKQTHCENKQLHYWLGDLESFLFYQRTASIRSAVVQGV